MVILDVPEDRVESLVEALDAIGLKVRPSTFRRQTMACTGIEYCKLAIVETKATATTLIARAGEPPARLRAPPHDQRERLPELRAPASRSPTSASRASSSSTRRASRSRASRSTWAARLGATPGFGRKVRGLKTTAEDLPDYVERVASNYAKQRHDDEAFAAWVQRADERRNTGLEEADLQKLE